MSTRLFFSIIITTYNRSLFIEKAVCSALSQIISGDELIVVDDGSQDDTLDILKKFGDRIHVLHTIHGGAGRARNLGIEKASKDLVAFLDSDDTWLPGKLQIQRVFMEARPDILFCFTNFEVEYRDGSVKKRYLELWQRDFKSLQDAFNPGIKYSSVAPLPNGILDFMVYEADLYRLQLTGFYILTDTFVARRKKAGNSLYFAEDLQTYEDLECFYRVSQVGKGAFLDIETARQLDHSHGRLSQLGVLKQIDARVTLIERFWGADIDFLAKNTGIYQKTLDKSLREKAWLIFLSGYKYEARRIIRRMTRMPLFLLIFTYLPTFLVRFLLVLRSFLKDRIFFNKDNQNRYSDIE